MTEILPETKKNEQNTPKTQKMTKIPSKPKNDKIPPRPKSLQKNPKT